MVAGGNRHRGSFGTEVHGGLSFMVDPFVSPSLFLVESCIYVTMTVASLRWASCLMTGQFVHLQISVTRSETRGSIGCVRRRHLVCFVGIYLRLSPWSVGFDCRVFNWAICRGIISLQTVASYGACRHLPAMHHSNAYTLHSRNI